MVDGGNGPFWARTWLSGGPAVAQRWVVLAGFILLVGGVMGGCRKSPGPAPARPLEILCGNSFVAPVDKLCAEFTAQTGIRTAISAAGSEDFLPLIKVGRKGDVLVTHDPYLDYVKEADALGDHVEVGFVAPVLAVQKGNPGSIQSLADLARPGLKVALTDPQYSTCGEMVFRLLEKKNLKETVLANVGNRLTKGHASLGTFLKTRTVDAAILWNGVARAFAEDLEIVALPYEYDSEIRVHIIALSTSQESDQLSQFLAFARRRAPAIFAEHGYVK